MSNIIVSYFKNQLEELRENCDALSEFHSSDENEEAIRIIKDKSKILPAAIGYFESLIDSSDLEEQAGMLPDYILSSAAKSAKQCVKDVRDAVEIHETKVRRIMNSCFSHIEVLNGDPIKDDENDG